MPGRRVLVVSEDERQAELVESLLAEAGLELSGRENTLDGAWHSTESARAELAVICVAPEEAHDGYEWTRASIAKQNMPSLIMLPERDPDHGAQWPEGYPIAYMGMHAETIEAMAEWAIARHAMERETHGMRQQLERESFMALRKEEHRYEALLEAISDCVFVLDHEYCVLVANQVAVKLTGSSLDQIHGMPLTRLIPGVRRTSFFRLMRDVMRSGMPNAAVVSFPEIGQTERWFEVRAYPVPAGVLGIATNITERIQAEKALQRAHDELEARVHERTAMLAESEARLRSLIESIDGIVWEAAPDQPLPRTMSRQAERILGCPEINASPGKPLAQSPMSDEDTTRLLDACREAVTCRMVVEIDYQMRSVDGRPLWIRDRITPVVDHDRVVALCGVMVDVTRRKEAEEEIARNDALLQALMENSHDYIYFKDTECRFTRINRALASYMGIDDPRMAIGMSDADCSPPAEAHDSLAHELKMLLTGEPIINNIVRRTRPADGTFQWLASSKAVIRGSSQEIVGLVGVTRNITEQKRSEYALRESEERFRLLFEMSPSGIYLSHIDGSAIQANHAFLDMIGCDAEAFSKMTCEDLVMDYPNPEYDRQMQVLIATGNCGPYETSFRHASGSSVPALITSVVMIGLSGEQRIWTVVTDITERKQAEDQLRRAAQRLAEAERIGRMGTWDQNIQTKELWWSDGVYELFGVSRDDFRGTQQAFFELVHQDDLPDLLAYSDRVIAERGRYSIDHRISLPDGQVRYVHEEAEVQCDMWGEPLRLTGFVQDISEQKRIESILRASEERYRTIVETCLEGVLLCDQEMRITFVNRHMARMLGMTEEAMLGRSVLEFIAESHHRHQLRRFSRRKLGFAGKFDLCYLHRNGKEVWTIDSGSPLFDTSGHFSGALSMVTDMTERRKAEAEARLREQQLIQTDKMASLGTLVAGVAHEINNPNQFIMSNAGLLRDAWKAALPVLDQYRDDNGDFLLAGLEYSELRDRIPSTCADVLAGGRRIQTIVDELRQYSKSAPEHYASPIMLNDVVRSAATLLAVMIRNATTRFELNLEEELPLVMGNYQRMEQVVLNLLQNACQALPNRDRSIFISTSASEDCNNVILIVRDEGIGVSEEALRHITDLFFTTKRESGGTGIGLAIASRIVTEHHGVLEFTSAPGKGFTATVRLPAAKDTREDDASGMFSPPSMIPDKGVSGNDETDTSGGS